MHVTLPKRRVDYVLIVSNLFASVASFTSFLYAISVTIQLGVSTKLQLADNKLQSLFIISNLYLWIGSTLCMLSGAVGCYVSYSKQYDWYRMVISGSLFCLSPLLLGISYSVDASSLISKSNPDFSTYFHDETHDTLKLRYTGDLRTSSPWSVHWDYFQLKIVYLTPSYYWRFCLLKNTVIIFIFIIAIMLSRAMMNGCCGFDGPEDYLQEGYLEYFDESLSFARSELTKTYTIPRRFPRSCCYYKDDYDIDPQPLDDWYKRFIAAKPGSKFVEVPVSMSEEFALCISNTTNTVYYLSEEPCYDKLRKQILSWISVLTMMHLIPLLTLGFCELLSMWYLWNQAYGLPSDIDLYISNVKAGLHRESDPDSVVLAINYPIPSETHQSTRYQEMLRSHLINEKPGDTQATKMLTVCKRTDSPTNGVSVSPEGVVQRDRIASIPTDRAPTTTNNPLTAIQQPRVSTTKVSALPSNKVTPGPTVASIPNLSPKKRRKVVAA